MRVGLLCGDRVRFSMPTSRTRDVNLHTVVEESFGEARLGDSLAEPQAPDVVHYHYYCSSALRGSQRPGPGIP